MLFQFVKPTNNGEPLVATSLGNVVWLALNFYGAKCIKRCIRVRGVWYAWI